MVTEGLPVPCTVCFDHDLALYPLPGHERPRTAAHGLPDALHVSTLTADALRNIPFTTPRSASLPASEQEAQSHRAALLKTSLAGAAIPPAGASAIETPPESPRRTSENEAQALQLPRRDSSYRKTYDEYVTKRAGPCNNCALTLPKRQDFDIERSDLRADTRGPTLRTKAPYAKVFNSVGQASPATSRSQSPSNSDDEEGRADNQTRGAHRRRPTSTTPRSSMSSMTRPESHTHYLEYISTKEPLLPTSFSIVRASCLRTLSFETLPRAPTTGSLTPSASPQLDSTSTFVTTHSAGSAASGGPIFFGDPLAGYTTAYIFRIPDVHARGHKRVYAFLALSTHRERLAMKTFNFIASAFRDLAAWIQQLAEAEAETAAEAMSPRNGDPGDDGGYPLTSPEPTGLDRGGSSFLTGGSAFARRLAGGGGSGAGVSLKARGLAELVGLPDFFIELHSRFVRLLLELSVKLHA